MPAPKTVAEKLLADIQEVSARQNELLKKSERRALKEDKKADRATKKEIRRTKKVEEVAEEQQGQEVQLTKRAQHETEKLRSIEGREEQRDINNLKELKDEDGKKVKAEVKERKDAKARDVKYVDWVQKEAQKREQKEDKRAQLADAAAALGTKKRIQIQTHQWGEDASQRLKQMSGMDNLTGALKTDFSLIAGSLGMLQSIPGFQTVLTAVKMILSKFTLWAMGKLPQSLQEWFNELKPLDDEKAAWEAMTDKGSIYVHDIHTEKQLQKLNDFLGVGAEPEGTAYDASGKKYAPAGRSSRAKGQKRIPKGEPGAGQFIKEVGGIRKVLTDFTGTLKNGAMMFLAVNMSWLKGTKLFKWASGLLTKALTGLTTVLGWAAKGIRVAFTALKAGFMSIIAAIMSPIGLIVIGVILLAVGLYLAWDWVKTKWNEGVEKVKAFGTMVGQWLSDKFKSLGLKIRGAWVTIMEGLQNAVNWVIEKVNKVLPSRMEIDKVDFAEGMRAELEADEAAFEAEKASRGQQVEDGSTALRAAGGGTGTAGGDSQVVSNNVTNINKSTSYEISTTNPSDLYGGTFAGMRVDIN